MWWDGFIDSPVVGDIAHQESKQNTALWSEKLPTAEKVLKVWHKGMNRLLLSRISTRGGITIAKHKGIKPTHPSYNNLSSTTLEVSAQVSCCLLMYFLEVDQRCRGRVVP